MTNHGPKIIFGGGAIGNHPNFDTPEKIEEFMKVLVEERINTIDTAQAYGASEEMLGKSNAASRFIIDTKWPGGLAPTEGTKEVIVASAEESLKKLKASNVDVFYIHAPERTKPLEPILAGINALHKSGMFKRFGLSNFRADEVEEVVRIAKENNYILPSVYQGNYSAVARRTETELVPTLRKYGIAFYAYSPIAGGFLSKTPAELKEGGKGRWDPTSFLGQLYHALYTKPVMLEALEQWGKIAEEIGASRSELAYRWVTYNSILKEELGDGIIIGVGSVGQLKETLGGLKKGPLSEDVVGKIDQLWKMVEADSPLDNWNDFLSLQKK